MLQTHFAARSARPIAAFLIMGSLTGFVVGQRLGHPAPVAHRPVAARAAVVQRASGSLGTPVVHPLVQTLAAQPAAHPAAQPSDHGGDHKHDNGDKHDKHGDGGGGDSGGHGNGGGGGGD